MEMSCHLSLPHIRKSSTNRQSVTRRGEGEGEGEGGGVCEGVCGVSALKRLQPVLDCAEPPEAHRWMGGLAGVIGGMRCEGSDFLHLLGIFFFLLSCLLSCKGHAHGQLGVKAQSWGHLSV